jgi:phosphatidyl-myo-inositol dimannoside synthase
VGGVQEAGRLTGAALDEIAHSRGWVTDFLSLNDPPGLHSIDISGHAIFLQGFARAKMQFLLTAVYRGRSLPRVPIGLVLAAHPNLALPALWIHQSRPHLKVVVMSHGIEVWKPLPILQRRALAKADVVLAPSKDTAIKLVDVQGVAPDKVRKVAWPLNSAFLRLADAPAKLRLPAAFPRGRVILTVGRWVASERYKGADELIRAVAHLRTSIPILHLVAVGGGDDLPRLRTLAADLGVAACVHFLENLSREEIAACYAQADLFALPSTGEGFGLVFLEAMAFARPVIGASCGGTTDVIEDGVNGLLVPPQDLDHLVHTLNRLLHDAQLSTELGRRGAEIVRKTYSFDTFRGNLENILEDCGLRGSTLAR